MPIAVRSLGFLAMLGTFFIPGLASAAQPQPWQMDFQEPATPLMEQIVGFHDILLIVITLISLFVLALLAYVAFKFNEKSNPKPSRTTHNTTIEVLWTVIPVLILVVIAVPSFKLLYKADVIPKVDMTIKATGHQWYWNYEYVDHGKFSFDANMVAEEDLKEGQPRLLETDNRVVVPVNSVIRLQVTAADVLHSWTIPAFGQKIDAVPGRLNEIWFGPIKNEGVYYGQCSELCGIRHSFMPIAVEVVSKKEFAIWVERAKNEFASDDAKPQRKFAKNEMK
ncbi:MAG: cytochrome c oxidase subunit 2 [Alphaproteobacteria bacterium MarineAlpha11_Bin1]|nr:MAG: cytochrome c oxidase subunit 2 [Alphaproteobacteria bacterium MarineAlpha11_Bin1]|tara:strand:+ start:361 stop:1200 length:840 start_codon:yes stop_codon:yes gene_type:complete